MKHKLYGFTLLLALFFVGITPTKACHGVALVNFSTTLNATSITVNGSSGSATCGCGPYYMEVEVACFSAANFTGNAPTCNAATWNVYPWYRALLNVPNYTAAAGWPDNCVVEPYNPVTLNFASLCPGTNYVLRARERVCGSGSAGPWSPTVSFTTPGTPPTFSVTAAANPNTICAGTPVTLTAVVNGSGGCGNGTPNFVWTPGNLVGSTVTVTPAVTTVYTVTVTGGFLACYPVAPATVTVTVLPPPIAGTASASPLTVCSGSCVTLTLTGSTGTIQWQSSPNGITWTNIAGATTAVYSYCPVTAAIYFRAVVSGAPGCGTANSNVILVGIIPTPTLSVNPSNPQICNGQSVSLTVTGASGYTWTDPSGTIGSTATINVSPAVTTTYTVTSTGTCPGTQTVQVIVNALPVIVFSPPSAAICIGSSVTLDAGTNSNTYTWSPNLSLTYLSPSQDSVSANPVTTTTYTVTATTAAGCIVNDSITVTVNPSPVLSLSDDSLILCPNMTDTVTISGASTYVWNPMAGANLLLPDGSQVEFNPVASTTYTVVGTTSSGCIDSTQVVVIVSNSIVVDAGLPDSICPGSSAILNASGGTIYSWTSPNNSPITGALTSNPSVTPSVTTYFTVNVTNQYGCQGIDSVEVYVRNLPSPNAGVDAAICVGASANLNGTGGGIYSWAGSNITSGANTSNPTVAPIATSDYILTVTDNFGCVNNDTVNILVHALPNVSAGPDQNICGTNCATLIANGGVGYSWSPPLGLSSTTNDTTIACPQFSTTYISTITDQFGCVNSDTVQVIVNPPLSIVASVDDSICSGGISNVSATASGGNGGPYTYSWSPATGLGNASAQSTSASPTVTTTYTVTLTDACGSTAVLDSVTITIFATPVMNVTPSVTSGCAPLCVDFTGTSNPAAVSCSYTFGDGNTSSNCAPTNCYTLAGNYTVVYIITDVNGCTNTITYPNLITVHPNPIAGFVATPTITSILSPDISFTPTCTNADTTIYMIANSTSSTDTVITNLVQNFVYSFNDTGYFNIVQIAINQWGCIDSTSDVIYIQPDWSFFAPNAFTPNGDGKNDDFLVFGEGIDNSTFELYVFDRWGDLIFTSNDIQKGWNGTYKTAEMCQIDTYVWHVKFKDILSQPHIYVGHVSLIR